MQLTRAARDFGFNDEERDVYMGGIVSGIFFTVGAPAAILVRALLPNNNNYNTVTVNRNSNIDLGTLSRGTCEFTMGDSYQC